MYPYYGYITLKWNTTRKNITYLNLSNTFDGYGKLKRSSKTSVWPLIQQA